MADWTYTTHRDEHLDEHNQFDHTSLASLIEGRVLGVSGGKIVQLDVQNVAKVVTTNYTVQSGDTVILADTLSGGFTVTLPDTSVFDLESILIKRIVGGGAVNVTCSGSDLINTDGSTASTKVLNSIGASWASTCRDATARWYTVGEHGTVA